MVLEDPFVWPPMERRGEFAAASLQAESYLEREHNARWAALGVAHATSGITANVLTLLLPPAPPQTFLRATSSILTYKLRGAKRWNNGNRVLITMSLQIRWANRLPIHPQPAFLTVNSPS